MGLEDEEAKLSLFSVSPKMKSLSTPPLQGCSAAVPFLWEEEPGKPRPCSALVPTAGAAQLELPPRLLPSPSTALGGAYTKKRPKASSFRMSSIRTRKEQRSGSYGSLSFSPERPSPWKLHLALSSRRWKSKEKGCFFGGWRKLEINRSEVAAGDSFVFPSDSLHRDCDYDDEHKQEHRLMKKVMTKITRTGSFTQTKSEFWATIYGGLKQVMPWKGKKTGFVN